ncbi:class I SAM-dependent methyltransferase [Clostridium oryzae]|uniref:Ubiquinone biosynthesis O-methyltransferase n=1 Tax=Clostridium oryzae TaxID=1450648 RepID=A0A1V4ISH4_9CLOT|nr:class I SAM-dependent methyltransferase [Clostridium oryzae]OPJ62849.1 ubiquinone biosynthesis O-methyltransferase [Clostridium oryzae]
MKIVFRQVQLYKFLQYCNETNMDKIVLDCGAGGNCPPLALFADHGYKTYGIELSDSQLEKAKEFEKENGLKLNIIKGDMRKLSFGDDSMSYVYSWGSIFHMSKNDIARSINEIKRVLKPGGLCFVNFLSKDDFRYEQGEKIGYGEYIQDEDGSDVIHSYFDDEEAEKYLRDMNIIYKEKRVFHRIYEGKQIRQGYIDYIFKK